MSKRKEKPASNAIYEYYQAISQGSVVVGKWIRLWYEYLIHGLEEKRFHFDDRKANLAVNFIENFCRHHEGALGGELIHLELWQRALIQTLFGIVDDEGNRQFRESFIVVGRKNGKTLLASAVSACMAYIDGEYGAKIYMIAPKLQQASLCFDGFYQMVQKEPELNDISKKRRTDIYIPSLNTSIQPLAFSAKKSDGLNPHLCVLDELSSWPGEQGTKQYEVLKSALGARKQPMVLSISTAGYVNGGPYDELMKRSTQLLMGNSKESRLAPFIYQIDDEDKWNDINELRKSNPNLGVSVSVDFLIEEIKVAEMSMAKKTEFLVKYCNIKQNAVQSWLSAATINKCRGEELRFEDFAHTYCVAGIDLSKSTDLTALAIVIEKNGILNCFVHFWLPFNKLEEASQRDSIPYAQYVERGILTLSGESSVNYKDVYDYLTNLVEQYEILPLCVGYDRWMSDYLIQDLRQYGFMCDDVRQYFNLSPILRDFHSQCMEGKINIGNNDLVAIHMSDCATETAKINDRIRLIKIQDQPNVHIDAVAAITDALTMRSKYYEDYGEQLANK